jgi:hypothetical protein
MELGERPRGLPDVRREGDGCGTCGIQREGDDLLVRPGKLEGILPARPPPAAVVTGRSPATALADIVEGVDEDTLRSVVEVVGPR